MWCYCVGFVVFWFVVFVLFVLLMLVSVILDELDVWFGMLGYVLFGVFFV